MGVDFQVAFEKLMNFETSEDIRGFFQDMGITGVTKSSTFCPIANWFKETTDVGHIMVGGLLYTPGHGLNDNGQISEADKSYFYLSQASLHFMANFDNGDYPELIDWEKDVTAIYGIE